MAVKPLKDLLKEADSFSRGLGLNKLASVQAAPVSDSVADFAKSLMAAESISERDEEFEKTAMAMNRAEALLQIQTFQKLAAFKEKALQDGHTEEQVNEAIEKISAKKVHENLAMLTALDAVGDPGKDKNSLVKKKVPAHMIGQTPQDLELTRSLGHGK